MAVDRKTQTRMRAITVYKSESEIEAFITGAKWADETMPEEATRVPIDERYYFVNSIGEIENDIDNYSKVDNARFAKGNYFNTSMQAKASKFYEVYNKKEKKA
jgi:hypothetical protein